MRISPRLLARLLSFFVLSASLPARAVDSADVRAFEKALEVESTRLLTEARGRVTPEQLTIMQRTLQSFRLKAHATGAAAKFVKQLGKKSAKAIVVTEVLTTALGLGLAGAGMPGFGSIFAAPVWAPIGGTTYLGYRSVVEEVELSRELKHMSMLELRGLRKEILGFAAKSRLFADTMQSGQEATAGLQVVKGRSAAVGAIGVADLEDIIRRGSDIDRSFLEAVFSDKTDPALYGRELAAYIHQDPSLADDLSRTIATHGPADPTLSKPAADSARRFLLKIDDIKKETAFAEKILLDDLSSSMHFINSLDLKPAEKKSLINPIKTIVTTRLEELQSISRDLRAEEYRFLDAYQRSEGAEEAVKGAMERLEPKVAAVDARASKLAKLSAVHVKTSSVVRALDPMDAREFLTGDPLAHPSLRNWCARFFGFLH